MKVRQALSMAIDRRASSTRTTRAPAALPHALAQPRHVGLRARGLPGRTGTRCPSRRRTSEGARRCRGGRRGGQDDPLGTRHEIPALHDRGHADEVGRREHRAEGRARVRLGGQLHQLLHRSQGPRRASTASSPSTTRTTPTRRRLYSTFVMPDGTQNYAGYDNAAVTTAAERGRAEYDDTAQRAELVVAAQATHHRGAAVDPDRGAEDGAGHEQGRHRRAGPRSSTCSGRGRPRSAQR